MLLRLYDDDSPIEDSSKDRRQQSIPATLGQSPEPSDRRGAPADQPTDEHGHINKDAEQPADNVEGFVEDVDMSTT
jgi:hypothetical protein